MTKLIIIITAAAIIGIVVILIVPAIYDLGKGSFLDYLAKPQPVLNVVKVEKLDFSNEYVGGGNFFQTKNGRGRIIHLSPNFSEELTLKNLAGGFFDIPDDCSNCLLYMFHLKNTNNKAIENIILKYKINGHILLSKPRFVVPEEEEFVISNCENNSCQMKIVKLRSNGTLSFGIFTQNPGNLFEVSCEMQNGRCEINHLEIFYSDVVFGNKRAFLNYNGKEYKLPEVKQSTEIHQYQLINGVWTRYE